MNIQNLGRLLLYFGAFFYGYNLLLFLIGSYEVNFFDGILKVLSQNYASRGLVPYQDFGVVYAPGFYILFGKILPFNNVVESGFVIGLFYLLINVVSAVFIFGRDYKKWDNVGVGVFLIINGIMINIFNYGGAFSFFLLAFLFISIFYYLQYFNKWWMLILITVLEAVGVWFRWDWTLFMALYTIGFLIGALVFSYLKEKIFAGDIFGLILGLCGGYLLGLISLIWYLQRMNVWEQAKMFAIEIPIMLTNSYRNLPIPWINLPTSPNSMFYINFLLIGILFSQIIKMRRLVKLRELIIRLYIGGIGLIYTFYVWGRSDSWHFLAMWYFVGISYVVITQREIRLKKLQWLFILLVMPAVSMVWANRIYLIPRAGAAQKIIDLSIKDCKEESYGLAPKSIYVGRLSHDRYLYSFPGLYLIHPELAPATAFITEEPGVQSSCKYGEMVVIDLKSAEKPMVVFLDKSRQGYENNESATMKSCKKIENYLENNDYEFVGECMIFAALHEIRLYR